MYFLMKKKTKHFFIKNKPTGASFTHYYVHFIIFNIAFTLFILIILDVPLVFMVQGRLIRRFLNYRLIYYKKISIDIYVFLYTKRTNSTFKCGCLFDLGGSSSKYFLYVDFFALFEIVVIIYIINNLHSFHRRCYMISVSRFHN